MTEKLRILLGTGLFVAVMGVLAANDPNLRYGPEPRRNQFYSSEFENRGVRFDDRNFPPTLNDMRYSPFVDSRINLHQFRNFSPHLEYQRHYGFCGR